MGVNVDYRKMRDAYADIVIELAKNDPDIVFVSVDCGAHEREFFRAEGKGRLVEMGIAEANSACVAAGLAAEGLKPYVLNFAYLFGRMYNQMSLSISEDSYNVKMAAYYAGIWGIGGRSHNCITDLAMMRAMPNFSIYAPADYWETKTVVRKADAVVGPTYVRLSGVPTATVFDSEPDFRPLRRMTTGGRCTIFCHGTMVHESLLANKVGNLNATVVNVTQIKPLPEKELLAAARETERAVIVEEHSRIGGLGDALCAFLCQNGPIDIRVVAVPDVFPLSVLAETPDVYQHYGISHIDIIGAVRSLTGEKMAPAETGSRVVERRGGRRQ